MRMWMLAAGAAALAITAPALADKGGHGGGKGGQQQAQEGGGGGHVKTQKASRGGGGEVKVHGQGGRDHGTQQMATRVHGGGDKARGHTRVETARVKDHGSEIRADKALQKQDRRDARIAEKSLRHDTIVTDRDIVRGKGNGRFATVNGDNIVRVRDIDRGVVRVRDIDRDDLFGRRLGYGVGGCPPGLAKKAVPCLPPGQAAKLVGTPLSRAMRITALDPLPRSLRSLYLDNDDYYYRYGGGYVYRVDRSDALIASMIPLFGAALVGQPLAPNFVNSGYTPSYFNSFYPNSQYDCYRNGYGYVYETDCMTGLVEDVIPTYDRGYGVGQIMPASYSYYNVPYPYRSYYTDTNDYYYRYAPGAIYQVDRGTALISAVAALLTGGLTVGQPLPLGYSAYNVPLAYRPTYFDSPNTWYRYSNGYVYSVDPRTRLVTAVVV